jgi:hypothetical protein
MKYIILRNEEITQDMLDSINGEAITKPVTIWLVDPPEESPGGTASNYSYITTEEKYPSLFGDYIKFDEDGFNEAVSIIKSGLFLKHKNQGIADVDPTGRSIVRYAATVKGWHYQAHSVQFEVNKLNSIYNKDVDGNDLGFCEIKVYDANGDECTTQGSADVNGVKTVVTWKPDFDFEIISGNVRQMVKETVDTYIYVRLQSATGLPAPYNWFPVPFTQGGINLNYIGADEPLKTDGRASKLVKAGTNGDYFEIIANYEADLLTNENRHKMSVIFEIYKDPTS